MNKVEFSRTTKAPFAERYGNFIGGEWVAPKSGKYFENTSPVNGRVLCEIARSDASDVEAALDAHKEASEKCFIANSVNFPVRHEPTIQVAAV